MKNEKQMQLKWMTDLAHQEINLNWIINQFLHKQMRKCRENMKSI